MFHITFDHVCSASISDIQVLPVKRSMGRNSKAKIRFGSILDNSKMLYRVIIISPIEAMSYHENQNFDSINHKT